MELIVFVPVTKTVEHFTFSAVQDMKPLTYIELE